MPSPAKIYQQEIHDNTGFFATWLPGDPLEIGDVGVLEGGRFRRMSSLQKFSTRRGKSSQNVDYSSTQGTKVEVGTSAEIGGVGKAQIKIDFSRKGSFVFQALELQGWQLDNIMAVGEEIAKAHERQKWQKSWVLIESLHVATRVTVIVCEDNSANLVLAAAMEEAIPSISLVDPKVSLSVSSSRGKIMHLIGVSGLHPLYSCLRLKVPLFGSPSTKPVRGLTVAEHFSRPGIDELLAS